MNKIIITVLFLISISAKAQIGIGTTTPNQNAILDISDSAKGLLIPRMDSIHRKNIANTKGLIVFDTTTNCVWYNTGSGWVNVPPKGINAGDMIYWNGSQWLTVPSGQHGQTLSFCYGIPTWGGCLPLITTTVVSNITVISASSGGTISNDGGLAVTIRGICWNTSSNPTIALATKTNNGSGVGSFVSSITGLNSNTTYYVRAYATNSAGTSYGNEFNFTTDQGLAIGQSYGGGIIAYILQPGDPGYDANLTHGLIAAPSDQSIGLQWYNGSNTTTGATGTVLGTGNNNTNTIVSSQGSGSYAAKLCYDLILNLYDDWYLPSQNELYKLYLNKATIGGFTANYYWSSSENSSSEAWTYSFSNGSQSLGSKFLTFRVRAIRAF